MGPRKVRSSDLRKQVKSFPSQLECTKANGLKHSFPIYPFCEWKQYETDGFPHEDHTFRAIKRWTQHYWHNLYLVYNFQGPWSVVIFTLPDICLSIHLSVYPSLLFHSIFLSSWSNLDNTSPKEYSLYNGHAVTLNQVADFKVKGTADLKFETV